MKKDKQWYKDQAKKQAAKAFEGFNPKEYADNAIAKAQMELKSGEGETIENFAEGNEGNPLARHMAQHIDGHHITADTIIDVELMAAAVKLQKASEAGVVGAFDQMKRVMDYRLSLLPPDED